MTKKKRLVIALGGNALGNNLEEQVNAVKNTSIAIADLIEEGYEVVISHGNGPQVGTIHKAMEKVSNTPLYISGAMSQAYIAFDLENSLKEELYKRDIKDKDIVTIMTRVVVDKEDPLFLKASKPIGEFMTLEEAEEKRRLQSFDIIEDAGRGYRRVVPSPIPRKILEIRAIRTLLEGGQIVISCGGGGIPVLEGESGSLKGVEAVIDKDYSSSLLAKELDADILLILTGVEKVALNYGKANQEWIRNMTAREARKYIKEGHFLTGSMLPKVEAALDFVESRRGRLAIISLLTKAKEALKGESGTRISG